MSVAGITIEAAMKLVQFAQAAEACDPRLNSPGKLADAIKRVLIVTLAKQSHYFTGETATEMAFVEQRAMEEYHGNPQFKAFIDSQCMEIMLLVERYDPR